MPLCACAYTWQSTGGRYDTPKRFSCSFAPIGQIANYKIIKDGKTIYTGYLALIVHNPQIEAEMDAVITLFRAVPEIKHKQWRERGLMAPMEPEEMPQYAFSDLQMQLYYTIYI